MVQLIILTPIVWERKEKRSSIMKIRKVQERKVKGISWDFWFKKLKRIDPIQEVLRKLRNKNRGINERFSIIKINGRLFSFI
jgi:hypothetical protein